MHLPVRLTIDSAIVKKNWSVFKEDEELSYDERLHIFYIDDRKISVDLAEYENEVFQIIYKKI